MTDNEKRQKIVKAIRGHLARIACGGYTGFGGFDAESLRDNLVADIDFVIDSKE